MPFHAMQGPPDLNLSILRSRFHNNFNEKNSCMKVNASDVVSHHSIFHIMHGAGYHTAAFGKVTNDQSDWLLDPQGIDTLACQWSTTDYYSGACAACGACCAVCGV